MGLIFALRLPQHDFLTLVQQAASFKPWFTQVQLPSQAPSQMVLCTQADHKTAAQGSQYLFTCSRSFLSPPPTFLPHLWHVEVPQARDQTRATAATQAASDDDGSLTHCTTKEFPLLCFLSVFGVECGLASALSLVLHLLGNKIDLSLLSRVASMCLCRKGQGDIWLIFLLMCRSRSGLGTLSFAR